MARVGRFAAALWDAFFALIAGPLGWTTLDAGAATNEIDYWGGVALGALVMLPLYIALFRYGYRSQALWGLAERPPLSARTSP